ncbi:MULTISPECIES: fumarate/nitrate reduction transcriptional regulator Fnr [unclassified Pseudomonas]|jgi:CRP/FNR family transcriptional regulator|uniref:fumarate/nitrate reduction transcriptional regulator Fnr n=1 Tax=unclassified Pseudomonas TaxID=196821 RepID=UPI000BA4825B|nr:MULTISPECIES: fumarate/nitrate reduction transcriptional regulator Fnr [unclassified Pseudomonas]MDX9665103.1 fumarate/nitrate reduction transcriptional regulator Fnr [Pseudomonas sp. P5_152]QHD03055.1 transcriptional regulator FNR [Pseudomonas sp. S04]QHF35540.1 transcriptional regulator FNR [Pseudomonas sp. S19]
MLNSVALKHAEPLHCQSCKLAALCLPLALNSQDISALNEIIKRERPLRKGDYLFHQGDPFTSIYAIRSGTLKTSSLTSNGEEHIIGFHLPGELIGFSAMDLNAYTSTAQAQETTTVCEIPFDQLENLLEKIPKLRRQLIHIMSREIRDDQNMMRLLAKKNAQERLAAFLINLSVRFHANGYSAHQFRLSMTRQEIANYLGIATETTCRTFTFLQQQGLIQAQGKYIKIIDAPSLCELSDR